MCKEKELESIVSFLFYIVLDAVKKQFLNVKNKKLPVIDSSVV